MTEQYNKRLIELGKQVALTRKGFLFENNPEAIIFNSKLTHLLGFIDALECVTAESKEER